MNYIQNLSRDEMRSIKAGSSSDGQVYITCDGCQNSTCQGWADDCITGGFQICGPGRAGSSGPEYTCVSVSEPGEA